MKKDEKQLERKQKKAVPAVEHKSDPLTEEQMAEVTGGIPDTIITPPELVNPKP